MADGGNRVVPKPKTDKPVVFMESTLEVIAYLVGAYILWEVIRNPDSLKRLREPWVRPIEELGQK